MNLEVLNWIVRNAVEKIEELAEENNLDCRASVGVAEFLLGNGGDEAKLSPKQRFHFENCIKPLIERVPCSGVVGDVEDGDTCVGDGFIDDESLLGCYLEDDFLCQLCRHDVENMRDS